MTQDGERNDTLTAVEGLKVGQAQDADALTGCTVVLAAEGATGGVEVRGAAPGTRETDLLRPVRQVEKAHAVVLTGGSAFGLAAADGVVGYLAEQGIGLDVVVATVPIVPAAVLFDLAVGDPQVRPDAAMGRQAAAAASSEPVAEGNVGAGTGATVGKWFNPLGATKSGIGSAALRLEGGATVAALIAVNSVGEVRSEQGRWLAGARDPATGQVQSIRGAVAAEGAAAVDRQDPLPGTNTTIGVVATDAKLDKEQANKLAAMAQNGLASRIFPAATMWDGDTIFGLATGERPTDDTAAVFAAATRAAALAVERAVQAAEAAGGLPAGADVAGAPDSGPEGGGR